MTGTLAKILAFAGGVLAAPFVVTGLFRLFETSWPVLPVTVAIVAIGVLRGGLLRWAAAGFGVGVVGFEAFVVWVLDHLDDGGLGSL